MHSITASRFTASRFRRVSVIVGAGLLALTAAMPASAVMYSREAYEGTDAWSYDFCGPAVDVTATFSGRYSVRAGTGKDDDAFFGHDTFEFREVHVLRSDRKVGIVTGILNWKETRGTRVEGTIFAFDSIFSGQVVLRDGDGNVVFRDRGTIRETILFDTLGDDMPGGVYKDTLASALHGQYPGLTSDAFCDYWNH